ncbi:AAA family ATPase [Candidatus Bathyarchaeota archaeon]|jgi:hypothetical protein|nr:AAA family ATPase [Candidatus Bathyarchaeota archaeon]
MRVDVSFSKPYVPMINRISIKNFKGIRQCEIEDLSKVNLFIGRNSCGKSTIMEATYFTGKEFVGQNLPMCLWRRTDRGNLSARELWYDYDMSSDVNVELEFAESLVEMALRHTPQNDTVSVYLGSRGQGYPDRRDISCQYHKVPFAPATGKSRVEINSPYAGEIMEYFNRSVFVDPTIKTNVRQIEGSYLSVVKRSEEISSDLAKRIAEVYKTEPSWEFLPHQDFSPDSPSRFTILEGKRRLFFDNFGDGFHYGLAVLAIAKTLKNTGLFIEEIESHQHPEAIGKLISNLVEIAKMNNLQLFMTTHNRIVWGFLEKEFETDDERQKLLRIYHVVRNDDTGLVKCVPLTKENANDFWTTTDRDLYGPTKGN